MTRAIVLQVRITLPEKAALTNAARRVDLSLSAYVRARLRAAAVADLGSDDYHKLFMEPKS